MYIPVDAVGCHGTGRECNAGTARGVLDRRLGFEVTLMMDIAGFETAGTCGMYSVHCCEDP